ncbi:hypothetical protein B0T14DRAFT_497878 [Immersiella caudata]|uniref:F-box domain-containing protein n=1 Tax=Immersiella caudata TaxID=314043 RepID=A0AA40BWZ3_9PEZI|nr:hypothetical protein B0T14DRAFT_497878 [Immersiella caudata]
MRLDDPTSIHSLPNEILLRIAEFLVPEPVTASETDDSFIRNREQGKWCRFFEKRQSIVNLSLTSRRFRGIAGPLLYRNIFLKKPSSLCSLIVQLAQNPSLGPLVRHLNSTIDLRPENFDEVWNAWWSVLPRCLAANNGFDYPPSSPILLTHLPENWPTSKPGMRAEFAGFLLASLLGLTNCIEEFGILLPEHRGRPQNDDQEPPSTMGKWLLDGGTWPFPNPLGQLHGTTDTSFNACPTLPTSSRLRTEPYWPPPFLREVAVEYDDGTTGLDSIFLLEVVPHFEAIEHATLRQRYGFGSLDPPDILSPEHLKTVAGTTHLNALGYLDGLKRIPTIKSGGAGLCEHLDSLRAATVRVRDAPTGLNFTSSFNLSRALQHIQPSWTSALALRRKSLTLHYQNFRATPFGSLFRSLLRQMGNVESLCLRSSGRISNMGAHARELALYFGDPGEKYFPNIRRLALRLCISEKETLSVYGRYGRFRCLQGLRCLQELEITMEGLFGPLTNLGRVFGGQNFIPLVLGQAVPGQAVFGQAVEAESLGQIIRSLPANLETLIIGDWWSQYSDPRNLLPVQGNVGDDPSELRKGKSNKEDCLERLAAIQRATVEAMITLAPLLKRQAKIKRVVFLVFRWNAADVQDLMVGFLHTPFEPDNGEGTSKKARRKAKKSKITQESRIVNLYKELGIDFEFKTKRRKVFSKNLADVKYRLSCNRT